MESKNVMVISKEELLRYINNDYLKSIQNNSAGSIIITAGAGDIDQLVQPIKEILLDNIL